MILAKGNEILEYIPQRPPIVMVDKLIQSNESITETSLMIRKDNIFCQKGILNEAGIIENIAQTAALRAGYKFKSENQEILLGFIGAVKNLKIHYLPKIDTEIQTVVSLEYKIMDFTIITAKVKCKDQLVAECEMKIFLKKD